CREASGHADPIERDELFGEISLVWLPLVSARIAAHDLTLCVGYFQLHRPGSPLRKEIVHYRAVWGILRGRLVRRDRSVRVGAASYSKRRSRLEEKHTRGLHRCGELPQRRDVIEYPEGPSVRGH